MRRRVPVLHVRREDWRVSGADLRRHLRLGLPMGFQASIIAIGTLAVQVRLNGLGSEAVAAYTTAVRVDGLAVALLASLGLAVSMFVAQNLGARPARPHPARRRPGHLDVDRRLRVLLGASSSPAGPRSSGCSSARGRSASSRWRRTTCWSTACCTWCSGVLFVLRGALQGLGQTVIPTLTGVIELVCRVGAAGVLGAAFGYNGVVWGNPLAWIGAVILLVPAYMRATGG